MKKKLIALIIALVLLVVVYFLYQELNLVKKQKETKVETSTIESNLDENKTDFDKDIEDIENLDSEYQKMLDEENLNLENELNKF